MSVKTNEFINAEDIGKKQKEYIKSIGPNQEDFFTAGIRSAKDQRDMVKVSFHTDRGVRAFDVYQRWFLEKDTPLEYAGPPGYRFRLKSHREYISKILDNLIEAIPTESIPATVRKVNSSPFPKKQIILYGPPGTGKTYKTKERAIEILIGEKHV